MIHKRWQEPARRAQLLTSELVTDSARHAGGAEVRVDVWPADGSIAVVATDDGSAKRNDQAISVAFPNS